jgi:hypothetical protein
MERPNADGRDFVDITLRRVGAACWDEEVEVHVDAMGARRGVVTVLVGAAEETRAKVPEGDAGLRNVRERDPNVHR